MFVCRFKDAFQKTSPGFPDYGPQDIEEGLIGPVPGELVERLLCGLLTLVLNRKKIPVEYVTSVHPGSMLPHSSSRRVHQYGWLI